MSKVDGGGRADAGADGACAGVGATDARAEADAWGVAAPDMVVAVSEPDVEWSGKLGVELCCAERVVVRDG